MTTASRKQISNLLVWGYRALLSVGVPLSIWLITQFMDEVKAIKVNQAKYDKGIGLVTQVIDVQLLPGIKRNSRQIGGIDTTLRRLENMVNVHMAQSSERAHGE